MTLNIFITILLVLMNAFFVATEFAIVKVRASQLEIKIQSGNQFALLAKNIFHIWMLISRQRNWVLLLQVLG